MPQASFKARPVSAKLTGVSPRHPGCYARAPNRYFSGDQTGSSVTSLARNVTLCLHYVDRSAPISRFSARCNTPCLLTLLRQIPYLTGAFGGLRILPKYILVAGSAFAARISPRSLAASLHPTGIVPWLPSGGVLRDEAGGAPWRRSGSYAGGGKPRCDAKA